MMPDSPELLRTTLPGPSTEVDPAGGGPPAAAERPTEIERPTEVEPADAAPFDPFATREGGGPARWSRGPETVAPGPGAGAGDVDAEFGRLDDYEILDLLGQGALAKVYLARQVSLGRYVALKVSADRGAEAQTMACLEHDHIVRVFSEVADRPRDRRLICMQYVPGAALDRIIGRLNRLDRAEWSGRAFLDAIDALNPRPVALDPAGLRGREFLERSDWVEVVCWIGERLAEALAHAHGQGVLHRDIKPANILVTPYGRPMLADFNLSSDPRSKGGDLFGGTLAAMAPEHLDAFNPEDPTLRGAVDERSDIYSLGALLFELLTGRPPFAAPPADGSLADALRAMAAERRAGAPSPRSATSDVPELLDRAVRRCLEPDPARRFATAHELARALDGCREMRRVDRELPPSGPLLRAAERRPLTFMFLLTFLSHIVGSVVNVVYNFDQVVAELTPAGKASFFRMVFAYNAVIYPVCLGSATLIIRRGLRAWAPLVASGPIAADSVAEARRRVLAWPLWSVTLAAFGWLPGGVAFPLGLWLTAGPGDAVGPDVFGHFLASFWLSGLIAMTYSFFGVQFMAIRVLYPRLWVDARDLRAIAARELAPVVPRLRIFQFLAGSIPLASAALIVGLGIEDLSRTFRLLATALIVLGMAGIGMANAVTTILIRTITVLTGTAPQSRYG